MRVNSGKPKYATNQIWIERRLPCRRAGPPIERIGEPLSYGDGPANAPHLPAEAEAIIVSFEFIGVPEDDQRQAQYEGDREYPEERSSRPRPPALNYAANFVVLRRCGVGHPPLASHKGHVHGWMRSFNSRRSATETSETTQKRMSPDFHRTQLYPWRDPELSNRVAESLSGHTNTLMVCFRR